jgi:Flp pilus assembly protein TadD
VIAEPRAARDAETSAALGDGVRLFCAGDVAGAHRAFERAHRRAPGDPQAMSWYGLTLVLVERNVSLGVLYCDQAVRLAGPEPELALNQARVALALGHRERAVRAIARGLDRAPDDRGLCAAMGAVGRRRRPVLSFLRRDNPLNIWLGKLRYQLRRRGPRPAEPPSPLTLGLSTEAPEGRADA